MPIRPPAVRISRIAIGLLCAVALTACGSSGGTAAPAASQTDQSPAAGIPAASADSSSVGSSSVGAETTNEESNTAESSTDETPTLPSGESPDAGGTGGEGDCPISAADLTEITGYNWEFRVFEPARPLESDDTVTTTVCGFTAGEVVDEYGDPAFLRTDVITGADVVKQQQGYASTCTEFGGTLSTGAVSGGVYCTKGGVTVDGQVGGGDRLVEVLVNSGGEATAQLSAVFDQILAAVD